MKHSWIKLCWLLSILSVTYACESDRLIENGLIAFPNTQDTTLLPNWVEKLENPMIDWVRIYPGEVDESEPRIESAKITINPYYKKNAPSMSANPSPIFSTGYYAAPAEVITIVVPPALEGKTVGYIININGCNLDKPHTGGSAVANQKRYSYIRKSGSLEIGENKVFNYFGGGIYLTFGEEILGEYEFEIRGAVKSPDFKEGGDVQAWKEMLAKTKVPYGEIQCKRYILTLALPHLKNIPDPQKVCDFYNEFIKLCYHDYFGFIEDDTQPSTVPDNMRAFMAPWRSFCDYQMDGGAAHSGYPTVFGQSYEKRMADIEELSRAGHWGLWHENGHNFQNSKWKWSSQTEVTCNINIFKWYFSKLGYWAEGDRLNTFKGVAANYVAKDLPNKDFEKRSGDEQICPYIQLAYGLGWGVYKYLGIQNRTSKDYTNGGQKDFLAKRVSEYAGANMMPFFDDWGIAVSTSARIYIESFPDWLSTERGKKIGEFWKHFEYGPVTDPSEFDFYNEPDPSTFPDIKFGKLDRNGWTVSTTIPYVKDGSTGKPEDILDGSGSTFLSLYKPGKGTNTAKITPGLTIDMQTQNSFTYFTWQHRTNNTATGLRLQEVSIYGSNTGQDNDFTLIKANITINTGNNNEQKFELGKIHTYRYIKFVYEKWDTVNSQSIQVSEITLGV
mgnify:CR=1 FL=1